MDILYLVLLLLAYFSGSISTAIIVCRLLTLPDPRIVGSGNPGATNVHRIGGNTAALATLVGDLVKTALPVYLSIWFGYSPVQVSWIGVCALLGHCFPIFYRFKGGKGVASMFAVLLLVIPQLSLLAILCWTIIAWSFRRSSVASIFTAMIVPGFAARFFPQLFIPLCALALVVVFRHRKNIINLLRGKEPQLNETAIKAEEEYLPTDPANQKDRA